MIQDIHQLNQIAARYLREQDARDEALAISEASARYGERKIPIYTRGVFFTPEGLETALHDAEKIDVGAALPSKQISWNLSGPGPFRVALQCEGPSVLEAFSGDVSLFQGRRTSGTAILDVNEGRLTLTSSAYITQVNVYRYRSRDEGELIIGPFQIDGSVSARVIGHGDFVCELAHDYATSKDLDLSGTEPVVVSGGSLPWSVMQRYDASLAEPAWDSRITCGRFVTARESLTLKDATELDLEGTLLWSGLREWRRLSKLESPAFTGGDLYWTFVWGRAEGYDVAYDVHTGRKTAADEAAGFYLVGTANPANVLISGTAAAYGEPLRYAGDPQGLPGAPLLRHRGEHTLVPAGTYTRLYVEESSRSVLVRIRGRGVLRSVELEITQNFAAPDDRLVTTTRREDLAAYWGEEDPTPGVQTNLSGPGLLLLPT